MNGTNVAWFSENDYNNYVSLGYAASHTNVNESDNCYSKIENNVNLSSVNHF